jgi:hypothetical protein
MGGRKIRFHLVSVPYEVAKLSGLERQGWAVAPQHKHAQYTSKAANAPQASSRAHSHARVVPGGRGLVKSAAQAGWRRSDFLARNRVKDLLEICVVLEIALVPEIAVERPDLLARERVKASEEITVVLKLSERPGRDQQRPGPS